MELKSGFHVESKKARGFSLIELVIALGILGIVLMGTAAMFTAMMRQTHDLELTDRLTEFVQEFRTNLKSKDFCNPNIAHFSQQTIDTGAVSVTNSATYPQDMTVSKFTNLDGTDYLAPGKELPGLKGSNLKSLALTDIKPITADAKSYSAKLQIAIDKGENSQVANVLRTVSIYFKLGTVPQGNATTFSIESCTSLMSEYTEGDFQVMCQGMGGTWDTSRNACRAPSSFTPDDTVGAWVVNTETVTTTCGGIPCTTERRTSCPDAPPCPDGAGGSSSTTSGLMSDGGIGLTYFDGSRTDSSSGRLCLTIGTLCNKPAGGHRDPGGCFKCVPTEINSSIYTPPPPQPGTQG